MKERLFFILLTILTLSACQKNSTPIVITPEDYHNSVDKVTQVMIHDIFSPPVASRIYAYPNIAAYEILAKKENTYQSLANQLTEFKSIPEPKDTLNLNYDLAALIDLILQKIMVLKLLNIYQHGWIKTIINRLVPCLNFRWILMIPQDGSRLPQHI